MKKQGFLLLFPFLMLALTANGQTDMLIGQISGRSIVRENFDGQGTLLNKQTFKVGEIMEKNGNYAINVVAQMFDRDNKPTDTYSTLYSCKPDQASMMVMAFPFSDPGSKETEINASSTGFKGLYDLDHLRDIEMKLTFDSGLLNFFGSKSLIRIYGRTWDNGQNELDSKIEIKAYALGIRIKQLHYTVKEELNEDGLLKFQKFTEEDQSYFTMTYN